jgi:hypothetical protein
MMESGQRTRWDRSRFASDVDLCTSATTAYAPDVTVGPYQLGDAYGLGGDVDVESIAFVSCRSIGRRATLVTVATFRGHFLNVVQSAGSVDHVLEKALSLAGTLVASTPDQLVAFQSWLASKGQASLAMGFGERSTGWVARSQGHFVAREVSDLGLTRDIEHSESDLELLMRRATGDADLQAWRTVLEVGRADVLSCVALHLDGLDHPAPLH